MLLLLSFLRQPTCLSLEAALLTLAIDLGTFVPFVTFLADVQPLPFCDNYLLLLVVALHLMLSGLIATDWLLKVFDQNQSTPDVSQSTAS